MKTKKGKMIYQKSSNCAKNEKGERDSRLWNVAITIEFPPMDSEDYFDLMASLSGGKDFPRPDEEKLGVIVVFKEKNEIY